VDKVHCWSGLTTALLGEGDESTAVVLELLRDKALVAEGLVNEWEGRVLRGGRVLEEGLERWLLRGLLRGEF
jgi:hypothetical protein